MSLIKVTPEILEKFSLTLHPETEYISGSTGVTGSMPLSARPSPYWKELDKGSGQQGQPPFDESDYEMMVDLRALSQAAREARAAGNEFNMAGDLSRYMDLVNNSPQIRRNFKKFDIIRFETPFIANTEFLKKRYIKNCLMPKKVAFYDVSQFAYTNYHTLNFFTASTVPTDSAIIYPNTRWKNNAGKLNMMSGSSPYFPTGAFSFDFYINPRYTNDYEDGVFKAGTIFHCSSTYAVSLTSGSQKDENGLVSGYRLMLQLSHSADVSPSDIDLSIKNNQRSYPEDLVFVSTDNVLQRNKWHHITVRWGGDLVNDGSGSFIVDSKEYSHFRIPSSSILPPKHVEVDALVIGNYYEGFGDQSLFFNAEANRVEGVIKVSGEHNDPTNFSFNHPLNAEVHDLKIFSTFLEKPVIDTLETTGLRRNDIKNLLFFLPPHFVKESPRRHVLISPYHTAVKTTDYPFNSILAFSAGGHLINLENFTREFVTGRYPRLYQLTASVNHNPVPGMRANNLLYATASIRKRNLTILPNDNGRFRPDFSLLNTSSFSTSPFKSVRELINMSLVHLDCVLGDQFIENVPDGLISGDANYNAGLIGNNCGDGAVQFLDPNGNPYGYAQPSTRIYNDVRGDQQKWTPEDPSGVNDNMPTAANDNPHPNQPPQPTVYKRTRDCSSNNVVMFDISNMYYGNKILNETFFLTDPALSASSGKVKMTLRDNKRGGLYRCDARTNHAKWCNVGNIFYDEGIGIIKSPHLMFFGNRQFEIRFKGEQNIHIFTVNVPAEVGLINSSSNPEYKLISASFDANDYDPRFVYITGVNFHDDNLNVIMRANLAQPVKKRNSDELLIRVKEDF
jgi:hypothetical protein